MQKISVYLFFTVLFYSGSIRAQKLQHDWENYVASLKNKPVSINVDLGLRSSIPLPDMPYVVIIRLKLNQPNTYGMPYEDEAILLDTLEDKLAEGLIKYQGALYVGRFTQRSIREFYFYAGDTSKYMNAAGSVLQNFQNYQWLARANKDTAWDNYLNVLYPSELDKLMIDSRRKFEQLEKTQSNDMDKLFIHFIEFKDEASCKKFLQLPICSGFNVNELSTDPTTKHVRLLISVKTSLNRTWIEKNIPVVFSEAKKLGGLYKGWEYQR